MPRLVVIPPSGDITSEEYTTPEPDFEQIRRLGSIPEGYVQQITVNYGGKVCAGYVDEEGQLRGLAPNLRASRIDRFGRALVGKLVINVRDDARSCPKPRVHPTEHHSPECVAAFNRLEVAKIAVQSVQEGRDFRLEVFAAGWDAGVKEAMKIVRGE